MHLSLKSIELSGFKSFGKKSELIFTSPIASIVGPNGSGKSNVAEAFRFVLGEQSMKSMRSKKGEDLIWGGSPAMARANRASVKVTFDNSLSAGQSGKRLLDLDFNEVVVERVVYRDGQNEYLLNGSQVRLKDVIRLLAGANIGGSGYQIISQGEADRILNSSPRERREMVEDALGLKLYQHKKNEAQKKLEETASNIDKTKSLRRELTPHLNFLRTQVEKIEKAREMKEELAFKMHEYLSRENAYITQENARLLDEVRGYDGEAKGFVTKLEEARRILAEGKRENDPNTGGEEICVIEGKLQSVRQEVAQIGRELGRAEGALEVNTVTVEQIVTVPHVRQFARDVEGVLDEAQRSDDLGHVRHLLIQTRERIKSFIEGLSGTAPITSEEARQEVAAISANLERAEEEEQKIVIQLAAVRARIVVARDISFAAERESINLEGKLREARAQLSTVQFARAQIDVLRTRFEEEVREGIALIGSSIHGWDNVAIPPGSLSEDRSVQEKRRREIERLKIKIEESGIGNGDAIVREFRTTKERDEFLAKEMIDLEKSAASLEDIIVDLEKTIDARFSEGLVHINSALHTYFAKLFGGGEAKLTIEKPKRAPKSDLGDDEMGDVIPEEDELYAGLSIAVTLPRKKMHGLEVLSGGERALTSIALIFSMSQVNPPPFLILDETDAALDEANSKRYADMIRELGAHSQLIVITHNRATMAAAGELYGVTMGSDGVSKLLSVKFEEATKVAK
jgi:chromosome segregation protein